ncbi:hypothetical protein V8F33_006813 [Rhypophila sp. PSN 637]
MPFCFTLRSSSSSKDSHSNSRGLNPGPSKNNASTKAPTSAPVQKLKGMMRVTRTAKGVSTTNPADQQNNCVQVTLARLHNCATVDELWYFPPFTGRRVGDFPVVDNAAMFMLDKIGWAPAKFDWQSDHSASALQRMMVQLPSSGYFQDRRKTNFYLSYVTVIGGETFGHAVVGTVIFNGPGRELTWQFRDFQHGEGNDVSGHVLNATDICAIMLNMPRDTNKAEMIYRELINRNVKPPGGRGIGSPRPGSWTEQN